MGTVCLLSKKHEASEIFLCLIFMLRVSFTALILSTATGKSVKKLL